jgi:hypothetical protein
MNDTAHNIIQLNQKTVCGCEVAFSIWRIGWSIGLVFSFVIGWSIGLLFSFAIGWSIGLVFSFVKAGLLGWCSVLL